MNDASEKEEFCRTRSRNPKQLDSLRPVPPRKASAHRRRETRVLGFRADNKLSEAILNPSKKVDLFGLELLFSDLLMLPPAKSMGC